MPYSKPNGTGGQNQKPGANHSSANQTPEPAGTNGAASGFHKKAFSVGSTAGRADSAGAKEASSFFRWASS